MSTKIELQLLGGLTLSGPDVSPDAHVRRRHPLALLALAAAFPQGIGRDRLMAYLWPESAAQRASNSLRQTLFWVRNDLGDDLFLPERASGIQLDPCKVSVDLWSFREAIQKGAYCDAAAVYAGPFMDGFQIPGASEFSQWVDSERDRNAHAYMTALDGLAKEAERGGLYDDAVAWRRKEAAADPFSSRAALALLRSLAAAGDRTGAIAYAANYENLIRQHLEVDPDPAIAEFVTTLRTMPAAAARPIAVARASDPAPSVDPPRTHIAPVATVDRMPKRPWVVAALVLIVLAGFAGRTALSERTAAVADDPVIVIGSGIHNDAGRDTATMLIACEGPYCPSDLPQPAFLIARHGMYANPAPGTGYIAHVRDGSTRPPPGFECCTKATFEHKFALPASALSGTITVSLLADNQATVAINGVDFGGHTDGKDGQNYVGPAKLVTTTFPPDPSGINRLQIKFWGGGGAEGLNYRAIVTYEAGIDPKDEEITPR